MVPAYSRSYAPFRTPRGRRAARRRCGGPRRGAATKRRTAAQPFDLGVKGDDMPYYRVAGEIPGKRHVRFHRPDGGLYSEELMGEEGFVSDSSLLYHVYPPTAIVKSEGMAGAAEEGS